MPTHIPRPLLLVCAIFLAVMTPARAERKAPVVGVAPPQPIQLALKVRREGKTEIPLHIYGKANEPLKYLIRVPPEHGHLSEPRSTEREAAIVIYEPPTDLKITSDKFYIAVQNSVGVSAPVEVALTIVDQQPQLSFPDSIDFSAVRAGGSNYRMLEVANHGGLIATGEVVVQPPWKIEGKAGYRLHAGEVAVFKLIFSPTAGGSFEGVARFTSEPEHSTTLRGAAEASISAEPAQWVLQQTPGDTERAGTFELTNQLDTPCVLTLKTDKRLKIPAQLAIPPRGKGVVVVEALPNEVDGFETEVQLIGSELSLAIPVRVPALGPVIRPTSPTVSFGRVPSGKNARVEFELANIGGAPGTVSWEIGAPFLTPEGTATLAPGEKKTLPLEIDARNPGRYRGWIQFKYEAQTFDLPVQAEVIGNQKTNGARAPGEVGTRGHEVQTDEKKIPIIPAAGASLSADATPRAGVQVHDITSTGAILEWPASFSTATQYRVEVRTMRIQPTHTVEFVWEKLDNIPIERRGANYAATLNGLAPGQPAIIRVLSLKGKGEVGERLFAISLRTQPVVSWTANLPKFTALRGLLIVLALLVGWQLWERWRLRSILS